MLFTHLCPGPLGTVSSKSTAFILLSALSSGHGKQIWETLALSWMAAKCNIADKWVPILAKLALVSVVLELCDGEQTAPQAVSTIGHTRQLCGQLAPNRAGQSQNKHRHVETAEIQNCQH